MFHLCPVGPHLWDCISGGSCYISPNYYCKPHALELELLDGRVITPEDIERLEFSYETDAGR